MKKLLATSTLALALLSSSSFAVKTLKQVGVFNQNANVVVHSVRHMLNEQNERPQFAETRLISDFDLLANNALNFDPTTKENGIYKMNITLGAQNLEVLMLVDDLLPSGFIQVMTPTQNGSSALVQFYPDQTVPLVQDIADELPERNLFMIRSDAEQFSHTINTITVNFTRLENGCYYLSSISYPDDRLDIVLPQPAVQAAQVQAGGAAGAVEADNGLTDFERAQLLAFHLDEQEAQAGVAEAPADDDDLFAPVQAAQGADDLSEIERLALQFAQEDALAAQAGGDSLADIQRMALEFAEQDRLAALAEADDADEVVAVEPELSDAERQQLARRQMLADLHAARLARQAEREAAQAAADAHEHNQ